MKKILFLGYLVIVLVFLLTACGPKEPANHLEEIQQAGKMVAATSADFPPYEFVDEDGNITGFDVVLIKEIGVRMGIEVEVIDMPFDSLLAAVQEGKIDLTIAAFNYTEERDKSVDFTDAYQESWTVLVVKEDFAGTLETPEDIAGYVLASQTGSTGDTWVTETLIDTGMMPDENMFRYERVDQGMLDLQAGRVDIYLTDNVPAETYTKQMGGLKIITLPDIFEVKTVNIIVPEGDVELTEALNDVIAELKADGYIADLETTWLSGE